MRTDVIANMHENMQHDSIYDGTKLIDSDKPHRPDSLHNDSDKSHRPVSMLTRVEVQNVQQDTTSVRRFPVNIPDVVDSEDVTLQVGCAKVSVDVGVERWHTSKNVRAGSNDKGEHTMKPCTENGRVSTRRAEKKMIVC